MHGGKSGPLNGANPSGDFIESCGNAASGTAYWWSQDILKVDNNDHITERYTQFSATKRNPDFPDDYMMSENFLIEGSSIVNINNHAMPSILFPTLQMYPHTKMMFDIENTYDFTIKYRNHFSVDQTSELVLTKIEKKTTFQSIANYTDYTLVSLGKTSFSGILEINTTQLILSNETSDPDFN